MFNKYFLQNIVTLLLWIAVPVMIVVAFEIIPLIYGASVLVVILLTTLVLDRLATRLHNKGDFL